MILLGPLKDKERIKSLFDKAGICYNGNSGCVTASDREETLGFCLYDLDGERMIIHHIEPLDDISFVDGVLRSTLHIAAQRSIMNCFYSDTAPQDVFQKLGFIKDTEHKAIDIDKLFKSCCGC